MQQGRSVHRTVFSFSPDELPAGLIISGTQVYAATFYGNQYQVFTVPRQDKPVISFWANQWQGAFFPRFWTNPKWTLILGSPLKAFDQQFGRWLDMGMDMSKRMPEMMAGPSSIDTMMEMFGLQTPPTPGSADPKQPEPSESYDDEPNAKP